MRSNEKLDRGQCSGKKREGASFCGAAEAEAAWRGVVLSEGAGKDESRILHLGHWEEALLLTELRKLEG